MFYGKTKFLLVYALKCGKTELVQNVPKRLQNITNFVLTFCKLYSILYIENNDEPIEVKKTTTCANVVVLRYF